MVAQNVHVDYSEKINTDVPTQLSLKLDNKTYLKIDVKADLSSQKTVVFNCYTAKGGVVVGIVDQFKVPIKFIGIGEGIDDLKVFDKREFVSSLFSKEDIE